MQNNEINNPKTQGGHVLNDGMHPTPENSNNGQQPKMYYFPDNKVIKNQHGDEYQIFRHPTKMIFYIFDDSYGRTLFFKSREYKQDGKYIEEWIE